MKVFCLAILLFAAASFVQAVPVKKEEEAEPWKQNPLHIQARENEEVLNSLMERAIIVQEQVVRAQAASESARMKYQVSGDDENDGKALHEAYLAEKKFEQIFQDLIHTIELRKAKAREFYMENLRLAGVGIGGGGTGSQTTTDNTGLDFANQKDHDHHAGMEHEPFCFSGWCGHQPGMHRGGPSQDGPRQLDANQAGPSRVGWQKEVKTQVGGLFSGMSDTTSSHSGRWNYPQTGLEPSITNAINHGAHYGVRIHSETDHSNPIAEGTHHGGVSLSSAHQAGINLLALSQDEAIRAQSDLAPDHAQAHHAEPSHAGANHEGTSQDEMTQKDTVSKKISE